MILRSRSRILCLLIFESVITCLCGVAAVYIRFDKEAFRLLTLEGGWAKILLLVLVVQGAFYVFDLYDFRRIRSRAVLYLGIFQALGLASLLLALIFYAVPQMMLGRGVFLLSLLLMLTAMASWRLFITWLMGHPRLTERILILGTEQSAIDLARDVLDRRGEGYQVVGFVGDDPSLVGQSLINPCVVGLSDDLEQIVLSHRPDRIVVAINDRRGRMPVASLLNLRLRHKVAIEEAASFYERLTGKISTAALRPSWLIFSGTSRPLRIYNRVRTLLEITMAAVGIIVASPVMLLTALAIKLESRGPVLYTQERVGLQDKPFTILKFRSMHVDAERDGPVWAGEPDPRVTTVGRIIRKLRIDELPQFINVLRGEMSFIGPRPERPFFVKQLEREIPYYSQRHLVKPGLTGWAQVRYQYGASVEDSREKLDYDLYYIKNQSPLLDAIILFETFRIILFGRGAR